MIALTLAELADVLDGRLVLPVGVPDSTVVSGSVETDSRLVSPGSIFIAMPGEATDGHLFAAGAVASGAALVIAERELELDAPQLIVPRGTAALATLAREVVARVRAEGRLKVVAITGSNGKTTTKNMLRAILSTVGPTVAPEGSFNNHVGAPISMLRIDHDTEYLIVEMGAGGPGQIALLIDMVIPDISVVLSVGLAHVGIFGSVDEVERTKAEIVTRLPETAVAVLNADDQRVAAMSAKTAARPVYFGLGSSADVRADGLRLTIEGTSFTAITPEGSAPVALRILGEHHVYNALAALTVARELGVPLDRAVPPLESLVRAERWRMELLDAGDGVTVINDAYNASPDSMSAALKTLAQLTLGGRRSVAVLGEMAELGDFANEEHDRIGRLAVRLDIRRLIVVGDRARHIHNAAGLEGSWDGESVLVADPDEAYDVLRADLRAGDIVLVKSSKSAGLRFLGDRIAGVGATGVDR